MADRTPRRGDVRQVDFEPVRGHEQGRTRPAVVVSSDSFNAGPAGLLVVCPITSRIRPIRWHVPVMPPEGGLGTRSVVLCDQIRAVSIERSGRHLGRLTSPTMEAIDDRLRILLDL